MATGCSLIEKNLGIKPFETITTTDGKTISIEYVSVPFDEEGTLLRLEGMLYRDMNRSSWDGFVMTHGRKGPHPIRRNDEVERYRELNIALAERGCAVLMVVRRGYGNSDGPDSEFLDTPDESALAAGLDIKAGVEYLRRIPGVNRDSIVVMGHSQGGWAAMGASCLNIEGVTRAVNLCGGINYRNMGFGRVTKKVQRDWVAACGEIGKRNVIPMIWIYSENDENHPPDHVRDTFDAFVRAGGTGELYILGPYGQSGHLIVYEPSLFIDLILAPVPGKE